MQKPNFSIRAADRNYIEGVTEWYFITLIWSFLYLLILYKKKKIFINLKIMIINYYYTKKKKTDYIIIFFKVFKYTQVNDDFLIIFINTWSQIFVPEQRNLELLLYYDLLI